MKHPLFIIFFLFISFNSYASTYPPAIKRFHLSGFAQGTTWLIDYYSIDSIVSKSQIDSILIKIDSSLSLFKPYSLINQFNSSSTGVKGDKYFIDVVSKSIETYQITNGAFDIAYKTGGSDKIAIKKDSVIKLQPSISIDANGIAQGYSVDVIAEFLLSYNIRNFIVELGGEIRVSGEKQPAGEPFRVGIESPADGDSPNPFIQKIISLRSGAITTSGNYHKKDHIVNPSSGKPVNNELVAVTVYANDAVTADAYDNALMVMGLQRAMKFVNKHRQIAAHFIYRKPDGTFAEKETRRFRKIFLPKRQFAR